VRSSSPPSGALTAWPALFDDGGFEAGQRVLTVGAGGVVGKHAVRLAKRAGARVTATASPQSIAAVQAAGADEIVDRPAQRRPGPGRHTC